MSLATSRTSATTSKAGKGQAGVGERGRERGREGVRSWRNGPSKFCAETAGWSVFTRSLGSLLIMTVQLWPLFTHGHICSGNSRAKEVVEGRRGRGRQRRGGAGWERGEGGGE